MFSATVRHEHVVLLAGLCLNMATIGKPEFQLGNGLRRNGHKTLFRTLARDTHKALVEKQVADFQRAEFAHPQSAAVKHLDNGAVALPLGLRQVDSRFQAFHFVERQHLGQMFGFARRLKQFGGVVLDVAFVEQKIVIRAHPRQDACNGGNGDAQIVERGRKTV